jgi:catechol 2,3-dioxygenase-like lactoylglutathione lyase family enzyme
MKLRGAREDARGEGQACRRQHRHGGYRGGIMMAHGWIAMCGFRQPPTDQISRSEGGSGTPVPDLSIEVDDVDAASEAMRAACFPIEYGPLDEPWGARRFYMRDPSGSLVNVLAHFGSAP